MALREVRLFEVPYVGALAVSLLKGVSLPLEGGESLVVRPAHGGVLHASFLVIEARPSPVDDGSDLSASLVDPEVAALGPGQPDGAGVAPKRADQRQIDVIDAGVEVSGRVLGAEGESRQPRLPVVSGDAAEPLDEEVGQRLHMTVYGSGIWHGLDRSRGRTGCVLPGNDRTDAGDDQSLGTVLRMVVFLTVAVFLVSSCVACLASVFFLRYS